LSEIVKAVGQLAAESEAAQRKADIGRPRKWIYWNCRRSYSPFSNKANLKLRARLNAYELLFRVFASQVTA